MKHTVKKHTAKAVSFMLSAFALSGIALLKPATLTASANLDFTQNGVNWYKDDATKTITAVSLANPNATSAVFETRSTFPPSTWTYVIGEDMLRGNTKLKSIKIKSGIKRINASAFRNNSALTTINLTEATDLTTIGNSAFEECDALTTIQVSANTGLQSINYAAFYDCDGLKTVDFSALSQLKTIGTISFFQCSNLTSITVPTGLTTIGTQAFQSCSNLNYVYPYTWNHEKIFDCKLQSVGENAFAYSGLRGIELPPKVSSMGSYTFKNCTKLGYLIFANQSTITKLPANMCENDTALYRVSLPYTLEEIGPDCFKNCTYNGTAESYVGSGKKGLAFYFTDTNLALNTSTYKVDKYVKVVDSSGNEADWGTAFQGVHAIFKVYPNNRLHVARLSTPKNIDGTYKNNNSSGSVEFVFQTGNDGSGSLQAGPQDLQAPVVGNKYKGDSTFKLTAEQDKYYDLLAVRCYDSTGYRMKTGDFFKANLGYYFEYDIYASPDHPIDLVFWGRQGYSCGGGTTAQALPNTTSRSVPQGVMSISQVSADKGQTITCYAVVHPCYYKNSSGSYVYPDAETYVSAKTLTRRSSLTVNKNGGSAGTLNYTAVFKLPAPRPEYGADYVNFEGHNIYEQSQYNSLRDYTVYYGCRKKGTTTISWYGYKPNGLLPDTTYELFYGSNVSGTKTVVCQLDDYTTPALMLVKTPTASIDSTISLSYKMNLTKSLTQKSGTYEPYIYMVQTDEATGSTIKTQSKLVPDCFYQTQSGNYGNLYNVPFAVAPINMNDPVTIKNLYRSTAGGTWNLAVNSASNRQNPREYTYTVMNYLNNVISNPGSYGAATVEMMKATKAYGISSQQLFQHNYDKVSTADRSFVSSYISGVTENDLLPYKAVVTKSATRPEGILGTSLVVDCKTSTALRVKIFFDEDVQPSKFTYTIDNKSTTLSYDAQNDYYYLELSGIAPANLDVSHNFRIVDNSTNTYYQVSASVLSYSYASVHNSGASAANKNLSKALYRYAKAADAVA